MEHYLRLAGIVVWADQSKDYVMECSCGDSRCGNTEPDRKIESVKEVLNPRAIVKGIER